MKSFNNFWLDSVTLKEIIEFIDDYYRGEYLSHKLLTDAVTGKNYLDIGFENPYGDPVHEFFDAYGYYARSNNASSAVIGWRKLVAKCNNSRTFDGKTYVQNLEEVCSLHNQQELAH